MPYATQADLVARHGAEELLQLTDRDNIGVIDATVVAAALADADAVIDGYLARRYALPITPASALLARVACDLARYTLHGKSAADSVRAAYTDAMKVLRDLSEGVAVIAGALPATAAATPAAADTVRVVAPPRVFGPAGSAGIWP